MANADGYVLPKPGVPKTLGILNIIFGVLLVLLGLCTVGGLVVAPAAMSFVENKAKEVQSKVEEQHKADVKAIDDKIAAAKTDEEKKALEQEKTNSEAASPKVVQVDMSAATEVLQNPTIMAASFAAAISGLILHILLIVSGVGLIRLTPWGRSLATWWGGLQILQVLIFLGVNLLVVLPITKPQNEKQIEKMREAANAPGAGPDKAATLQMTEVMSKMAVPMTIGQSLSGVIYPIILLVLLGTAGAKAACLAKKPETLEDI